LKEDFLNIILFSNPFNFPDEELDLIDLNLQMEAVDLKKNSFKKKQDFGNKVQCNLIFIIYYFGTFIEKFRHLESRDIGLK